MGSKGEETKAAILERGIHITSRIGLEALSLGRLAEELRLSKSGIFAHFGSKEALQIGVLEETSRRFVEKVVRPALRQPRGEGRVRHLIKNWLAWDRTTGCEAGCPFIVACVELDDAPLTSPVRTRLVKMQQDWYDLLAGAVRHGVELGHFAPYTDCDQLAFELQGIAYAYHHHARLLGNPKAEERALIALDRLIERAQPQDPSARARR